MLAAVCNLVIDLLVVKKIGIYAASISTLISYLVLFVYRLIDVQKFQPLKINYGKMTVYFGCLMAMSILVAQRGIWLNLLNVVFGFCFAIIINRGLVGAVLKGITRKAINILHLKKR